TIKANVTLLSDADTNPANDEGYSWVKVKLEGDVDNSGRVVADDFFLLVDAFGSRPGDSNWDPNCDFDGSGRIVADDYFILAENFGERAW
ncbi:MAG: hypothetical protein JSV12_04715, partial [Candidatus Bathyarchaeota archaeon]